jgi:FKBP-type peptidyl-prolyl cis-trans isomerase
VPTEKRQRQKEGARARREAALAAARKQQRRRQLITFAVIAVAVVGLVFIASSRGGSSKKSKVSANGTTTTTAPETTPSTSKANPADKPKIDVPTEPAPTTLQTKDLTVGTGKEAKLGDTIEVNYVGVTYSDGKEFDSSWGRSATAAFQLKEPDATGGLIQGWVKGIPGMKVGGRRELIIPASMAYGDTPQQGQPAGALIFIVDLVSIQ